MSKQQRAVKISVLSRATSEAVYDVLVDLRSHLVWTGSRQTSMYHLEALEAPAGPAQVGTVFSSTGTIPMSVRRWHDRSVVKVADRPRTFEYLTEASTGPKGMAARYSHRYELVPTDSGSRITYTLTQLDATRSLLRLVLPVVGGMSWRFGIPMFVRPALRNLAAMAEKEVAASRAPVSVPVSTIQMQEK